MAIPKKVTKAEITLIRTMLENNSFIVLDKSGIGSSNKIVITDTSDESISEALLKVVRPYKKLN